MMLLQVLTHADSLTTATAMTTPPLTSPVESLSVMSLVLSGGYIMIPIFLLSMASVYLFVERWMYIRNNGKIDPQLLHQVKDRLMATDVNGAISVCGRYQQPMARLLEKGLYRLGNSTKEVESAIEASGNVIVNKMEKNLPLLAGIATIAPMLGFLGTVAGMIRTFYAISLTDNISMGTIAAGVYEKMVTSGAGLIVGIIAYVFYTYLNNMIDRYTGHMEETAIEFMDTLYKPTN